MQNTRVIFCLILISGCAGETGPYDINDQSFYIGITKSESSVTITGDEAFSRYFRLERTIELSGAYLIGHIGSLDVNRAGWLLITDRMNQRVVLYDQNGRYLQTLSAESCYPGYNWAPLYAEFDPNGGIVVINNGFLSLRFSKSGECIGTMRKMYMPPLALAPGAHGNLYGFYNDRNGYYISKMDSMGYEVSRFAEGAAYKNLFFRYPEVKMVYAQGDFIYVSLFFSPYIYKFGGQGIYYGFLGWKPDYYHVIKEDVPESVLGSRQKEMQLIREKIQASTSTLGVHLLKDDQLLVVYFNNYNAMRNPGKEVGVVVMDLEGRRLMGDEILTDRKAWFMCAKYGFAYSIRLSGQDDPTGLSNPVIDVYRFVHS